MINVGIKEIGTLKLQKKIGAIRKLYIDRDSTYVTCVQAICNAYKIKKHESMFLVDNENHNIVAEEFTVEHYVQNYSYKGATRLYLVVDLDILW